METDLLNFSEKVVWVTGAASGIGRATALRFAAHGARVFATDVNEAGLEEVATRILEGQQRVVICPCDVSESKQVAHAAAALKSEYGSLDVLANCAGIAAGAPVAAHDEALWQNILRVNLDGTMLCSKAAVPLLTQKGGAIVNVSSIEGLGGEKLLAAYCSSKHGVIGLTKVLARELAESGVRCNAVCPGPIDTPMLRQGADEISEKLRDAILKKTPLKRLGDPDEVAKAILFLASDLASYITGTTLTIDGGLTAGY